MGMTEGSALGSFLRERRARLRRQEAGVPVYDDRRRVPGLRRDELALLAGVSPSYYIRLEQGLSLRASAQVLDALARALRLDDAERQHLHDLSAAAGPRRPRRSAPERVSAATAQLLSAFGDSPAVVLGYRSDILAWNATGHALLAGHLPADGPDDPTRRPNTARLVFLDPHTRDLYVDWHVKARDVVGKLRYSVGRHPDDPRLAALIGELTMKSEDFATMWSEHKVRTWGLAQYRMHHPSVGLMEVMQQTIDVPDGQGLRMVVVTAAPGSASQAALTLLARSVARFEPQQAALQHGQTLQH